MGSVPATQNTTWVKQFKFVFLDFIAEIDQNVLFFQEE